MSEEKLSDECLEKPKKFFSLVLELVHVKEFNYKHYSFRKKHRLTKQYNRQEKECESLKCSQEVGLEQIKCTRECVSPHCYKEMYAWDELEEGEIDVRLNSFKGCVTNELQNKEMGKK